MHKRKKKKERGFESTKSEIKEKQQTPPQKYEGL